MLVIISPSKSQDFSDQSYNFKYTTPDFIDESQTLIKELRKKSKEEISSLMKVSENIAGLNYDRYKKWRPTFHEENAKPALLAFTGDVYLGFDTDNYTQADFDYAQAHLRIISGLYGLLRPTDLIQPYRLEMGVKLKNPKGTNLYQFWKEKLTASLKTTMQEQNEEVLINLASDEYSKSIDFPKLDVPVITPTFKDNKNGQYKVIAFNAKKARGLMANYIIKERITEVEDLMAFNGMGYIYNPSLSEENKPVFTR